MTFRKHTMEAWQRMKDLKDFYKANLNSNNMNSLVCFNGHETLDHFITKAMIFKILRDKGHIVFTEVDIGVGKPDIFDASTGRVYEVESKPDKQTLEDKKQRYRDCLQIVDFHVIDLRELTGDMEERFKRLQELVV